MRVVDHPISTRLEQYVGGNGRLLATVMALPLVDGLFPALLIAGVLDTWAGLFQVGILVFGGSAAAVVILTGFPNDFHAHLPEVTAIGIGLLAIALIEAALAPTFASLLNLELFKRFAAIVIVTIAAKTASARLGELLPRPSITIAFGVIASIQPANARLALVDDPALLVRTALAVGIAFGFVLLVLAARQPIATNLDIERFRFGSALALCLVAASILTPIPEATSVMVLGVVAVFAYTPRTTSSDTATSP